MFCKELINIIYYRETIVLSIGFALTQVRNINKRYNYELKSQKLIDNTEQTRRYKFRHDKKETQSHLV